MKVILLRPLALKIGSLLFHSKDGLTFTEIRKGTGLKNNTNVDKALKELIRESFVTYDDNARRYKITTGTEEELFKTEIVEFLKSNPHGVFYTETFEEDKLASIYDAFLFETPNKKDSETLVRIIEKDSSLWEEAEALSRKFGARIFDYYKEQCTGLFFSIFFYLHSRNP